jgi:PPM family protein phosphatase
MDHPQRSIITRALGPEREVEVDTMTYRARPGDVYLLCSDGLTTMVREDRIAATLANTESLDEAVSSLVREANEGGGRDNITVVAFRVEEAEQAAETKEQPTLIGPAAEEAGLTAGALAEAAGESATSRERVAGPDAATARTRRWPRRLAKSVAAVAVIAALVGAAIYGLHQVYFLGTDPGGRAALYRGLPYELPLGLELYMEIYSAPVQVSAIPASRRESATDHTLRSHDDAADLLTDLQSAAQPPVRKPKATDGERKKGQADARKGDSAQRAGSDGGGGQ